MMVAGAALGMGNAYADPTLEMPSWMGGDHDPSPLMAAMDAWDPTASMTATGARNEAVVICSTRNAGHSDADLLAVNAETHGASDNALYRPVIHAAEAHFCPQYS